MQFIVITVAALLAATGLAVPSAAQFEARSEVQVEFQGAADAAFTLYFPTDGSTKYIKNVLSISHIASYAPAGVYCVFYGNEKSVTYTSGTQTVDVGPPQTQFSGSCSY